MTAEMTGMLKKHGRPVRREEDDGGKSDEEWVKETSKDNKKRTRKEAKVGRQEPLSAPSGSWRPS